MGIFYDTVLIRATSQQDIVKRLWQAEIRAFVSPVVDGFVAVYLSFEHIESTETLADLAGLVSLALHEVSLAAMVQDSDVLMMSLVSVDGILYEYNSCPSYYTEEDPLPPTADDLTPLLEFIRRPAVRDELTAVLSATMFCDEPLYDFEEERHLDFLLKAGLPRMAALLSYDHIEAGLYIPDGMSADSFVSTS